MRHLSILVLGCILILTVTGCKKWCGDCYGDSADCRNDCYVDCRNDGPDSSTSAEQGYC